MSTLPLARSLLSHLGVEAAPAAAARLGQRLAQVVAEVKATWPGVDVPWDAFMAHVAARLPGAGAQAALESLHWSELYLACACLRHQPRALQHFEEGYLRDVSRYVARLDAHPAFADEIRQQLRNRLFVAEDGSVPKLAQYAGTGPLAGWLRVVAVRVARNAKRRTRSERPMPGTENDGDPGPLPLDPEVQYMKRRYGRAFRVAFQDALAGLPSRDRAVLALHLLEGLSSAAIGKSYGVHGATVRLWIRDARVELLQETTRLLKVQAGISEEELSSVVALVQSQLDLTLSRLLKRSGQSGVEKLPPTRP